MPGRKPSPRTVSASYRGRNQPARREAAGKPRQAPRRSPRRPPNTKDGPVYSTPGLKGEPPGQRRTVNRRAKVQRQRDARNTTALNKNIKSMQRRRPY